MMILQVDIKFINRYHHSWPSAIRLISAGYLNLKPLVTHRFSLAEAVDALTASANRAVGAIKIHIEDEKED
jgi:L-iditol 2-dehydrogenase